MIGDAFEYRLLEAVDRLAALGCEHELVDSGSLQAVSAEAEVAGAEAEVALQPKKNLQRMAAEAEMALPSCLNLAKLAAKTRCDSAFPSAHSAVRSNLNLVVNKLVEAPKEVQAAPPPSATVVQALEALQVTLAKALASPDSQAHQPPWAFP